MCLTHIVCRQRLVGGGLRVHTLHSLRLNTAAKLAGFHNLISYAQRVSSTAKLKFGLNYLVAQLIRLNRAD